jgi:hypothetical protein
MYVGTNYGFLVGDRKENGSGSNRFFAAAKSALGIPPS